jgi:hypothetical protein
MALAARTEDGGGSTRRAVDAAMPVSVNGVGVGSKGESEGAGDDNSGDDGGDVCDGDDNGDASDGGRDGGREVGGVHDGVVGANEDEEGDED